MRQSRCVSCRFFEAAGEDGGLCRRRAPVVISRRLPEPSDQGYLDELDASFPSVNRDDWCGEHETANQARL